MNHSKANLDKHLEMVDFHSFCKRILAHKPYHLFYTCTAYLHTYFKYMSNLLLNAKHFYEHFMFVGESQITSTFSIS